MTLLKPRGCENVGRNWHATQSIRWFESDSIDVPIWAIYDGKRTWATSWILSDLTMSCSLQNYRWKVGAKLSSGPGLQMKVQRVVTFPNCMGLGMSPKKKFMFCRKSVDLSFNAGIAQALEYQGRLVIEVNNLPVAPCPTLDKLVCCNEDSSENDVFVW